MAFIIKALGAGTLTVSGTADLYTVPAGKSAVINNVRLVNGNSTATSAMNLYVQPSGATDVRIYNKDFTISSSLSMVIPDVVTLGQGDKLRLAIGAAQNIGYMVNGAERG